ncbi:MAG: phage integrase N-terminal SAM-like domain-containing protein [Gammaproteobacteria bacterium]|nr:phage integrase N-terminal SAM-like domain-containing protein [Gammaproteobacteria bacterium]
MKLACLRRHYSPRTATSYVYWNKQFILFHNKKHPKEMGKNEIEEFLNYLVIQRHLSASSQSQALNAIIFMYKHIFDTKTEWLDNLVRVKRKKFLPVVLSISEVRDILGHMCGITKLMAKLIYCTGLRVSECVQLRIKDILFKLEQDAGLTF